MASMTNYRCSYCLFTTKYFALLLNHYTNSHANTPGFKVRCNIQSCLSSYDNISSFRKHVQRKHNIYMKKVTVDSVEENERVAEDNIFENVDLIPTTEEVVPVKKELNIKHIVARSLLKLREKMNVSCSASEYIAKESEEIASIVVNETSEAISKGNSNLNCDQKETVMAPLREMMNSYANLNTVRKQEIQFKKLGGFVEPKEIKLDENASFMYIPIVKTLQTLLQHDDVMHHVYKSDRSNPHLIESFSDGSLHKNNTLFKSPNKTIQIKLYFDDFQIVTPLGNKTRKHKICAMYWVLGNLPAKYRSKLYTIQLLGLTKSINIKKFGYRKILENAITDLKFLEDTGISVVASDGTTHHFFGTVSVIITDNLASHEIGGYVESFNSLRTCRFCNITNKDMQTCFDEKKCTLNTPELYDIKVNAVEVDPSQAITYGIRKNSVLNDLTHFHVCWGSPSDVAHDIYEGLGLDVLKLTIEHCIKQQYFSLEELNHRIKKFPFSGKHKTNKPPIFPGDKNKVTVKLTAAESSNMLHLLPLIIGDKVPKKDANWVLYVNFLQILDYVVAPSLCKGELLFLEKEISSFLSSWYNLYKVRVKPKAHYLLHYATQYAVFGPLCDCSTLRFEGKHSYFKSVFASSNNYINPCKTLATRHQFLQLYHHQNVDYLIDDYPTFKKQMSMPKGSLSAQLLDLVSPLTSDNSDNILLNQHVEVEGISYEEGSCVVLGHDGNEYTFGVIKFSLFSNGTVYLIIDSIANNTYDQHLNAYILSNSIQKWQAVALRDLLSPVCIPMYSVEKETIITLPHFIQF